MGLYFAQNITRELDKLRSRPWWLLRNNLHWILSASATRRAGSEYSSSSTSLCDNVVTEQARPTQRRYQLRTVLRSNRPMAPHTPNFTPFDPGPSGSV